MCTCDHMEAGVLITFSDISSYFFFVCRDMNTSNTSEEPTNPDWSQPADGEQTENAPM